MTYRDERGALHARVDSLEKELHAKRREVLELSRGGPPRERLHRLARDLAAAQEELTRLQGAASRPTRTKPILAFMGIVGAAAVAFAIHLHPRESYCARVAAASDFVTDSCPAPGYPRRQPLPHL
jgi:hypothetical protein